ncbi:MAG: divergent PAP2 family protein [Candidatus Omnitrophica bacterium]|nr:divergent PAP2 family protein [Candidatus Omnitrophota bacterium]
MNRFAQLFQNKVLWCTMLAWITAQTIKVLLAVRRNRRFDFRWFLETGGMPSAHSAGVAALATSVGLQMGFHTPGFAVALMFALVTMFDAQGVRRAAGRQAIILNKIIDEVYSKGQVSEERVKELLGHTPIEVIAGGFWGCFMTVLLFRL